MDKISNWNLGNHVALFLGKEIKTENYVNSTIIFWIRENKAIFLINKEKEEFDIDDDFLSDLREGDVISISEYGKCSVLYSKEDGEIDVFITNRCNSNCIMCPLSKYSRRERNEKHYEWLAEYINTLPDDVRYINITGGEPTLIKEHFFELMRLMKQKFCHSDFQLLSNGRSIADNSFLVNLLEAGPTGIRFAIPVHSSEEKLHDEITQVKGSFKETDRGIKNLLINRQKVEIRIVISKKNINSLTNTAKYILNNYPGIFCVVFISMEMMGNAAVNKDELWVDYTEAFNKAKPAIDLLAQAGIDVLLYNFPLCAVEKGYWYIAAKSISTYKIRYMDDCDSCSVKAICGGFFFSTKNIIKPKVYPIKTNEE